MKLATLKVQHFQADPELKIAYDALAADYTPYFRQLPDGRWSWSLKNGIGGVEDTYEKAQHVACKMLGV